MNTKTANMTEKSKEKFETAKELYELGKIDEAIEMLKDVPMNDDVRELHRALRYADEARGVVSNVSHETEKYFEELLKKLRIRKKELQMTEKMDGGSFDPNDPTYGQWA